MRKSPGNRRLGIGATIALAVLGCLLGAGGAAAAPSLDLVWSGTTGTGATGGSAIDASLGDTLTLDVILTIDPAGFTGAAFDLVGSGVTAASNTLIPGAGGPPECPSPPNLAPGTCFSVTFKSFSPLSAGVVDSGPETTGYDVAGLTAEFVPSTMTVGRGVFVVDGAGSGDVSTFFAPGVGGVTDGSFVYSIPPVSTAIFNGGPGMAALSATKTDSQLTDDDGDGFVDGGDQIEYEVVVTNTGSADALNASFSDPLSDANISLVVGTVMTTQGNVVTGNVGGDTTVEVDFGTISAGSSVTVTFDVEVVDPLPDGVLSVSNQGSASADGVGPVDTDDPDTGAADDATVTDVESALESCQDDLGACESDLGTCEADLSSCETDPPFEDADGDGEHDDTDACPGTPSATPVDQAGCSLAQFCASFDIAGPARNSPCNQADWGNDEPLGAEDCKAMQQVCEPR